MSLARFKRSIKVGTRLLCVQNTYRPELNGLERKVVKVQGNGFYWTGDPKNTRPSFTDYPPAKGCTWTADDTIRLPLNSQHFVELRILEVPSEPRTLEEMMTAHL